MTPSTAEHKSLPKYPSRHALVWVKPNGYRDLDMEYAVGKDGDLYTYGDKDAVVRLELDAEGIEFLLGYLPHGDGFTDALTYMRDLAKWDEAVSGR